MTDRIDPGPGWRLLKMGEVKIIGDEYRDGLRWATTKRAGDKIDETSLPTRRCATPRTTKAIATRATVRIAFADCVVDRVVSSPGGLGRENIDAMVAQFTDRTKAYQGTGIAKYIMLEIQREGEP